MLIPNIEDSPQPIFSPFSSGAPKDYPSQRGGSKVMERLEKYLLTETRYCGKYVKKD